MEQEQFLVTSLVSVEWVVPCEHSTPLKTRGSSHPKPVLFCHVALAGQMSCLLNLPSQWEPACWHLHVHATALTVMVLLNQDECHLMLLFYGDIAEPAAKSASAVEIVQALQAQFRSL